MEDYKHVKREGTNEQRAAIETSYQKRIEKLDNDIPRETDAAKIKAMTEERAALTKGRKAMENII